VSVSITLPLPKAPEESEIIFAAVYQDFSRQIEQRGS
jgi:hypothetical protein